MILQEQIKRITAEVMDSLKMQEAEVSTAGRYAKRAVNRILIHCNREDLPELLEDTAALIAEDMIREDLIKLPEKEVVSISRGDTAISYKSDTSRKQTVDFMRNYETTLNRYRKINLPKSSGRELYE